MTRKAIVLTSVPIINRITKQAALYGKEKKSLAYVLAIMNLILHGVDAPNIIHTNTLSENIADVQEKGRFHVVLANPPFGGKRSDSAKLD